MIARMVESMRIAWPGPGPLAMWVISIPLTWTGIERWLHGATTIVGFLTSVLGLLIACLGVVYWIRRLQRQITGKEDRS